MKASLKEDQRRQRMSQALKSNLKKRKANAKVKERLRNSTGKLEEI